ncbi:HNH endonuclease [Peribacillus asahii]|uniref:HNH endonuclease n=1 Tax=Peribacillus asahii TaxID=228899 RepID=UPI0013E2A279|nr:HNH endonuclease [Peribacillus asahii]
MKIREVFDSYINSDKTKSSLKVHKGKVDKYITFIGNQDIEKALDESLLRKYIFDKKQNPKGKYDALKNFYHYYYEEILNLSKLNFPVFPIDTKELVSRNNPEKRRPVYFSKEFDFNCLFDDRHYEHLNNHGAALAVKASLALALSAGYDSGEMFPTNGEHEKAMKMDDVFFEEDYIKVRNFSSQSTVPFILIQGKNAEYVKEYYKLRLSFPITKKFQQSLFIANTWKTNELNFDTKITTKMIYYPHDLVSYMLKYITVKEGQPTPLITDLRANMVLHSLYNSKGSALQDIIELYGFPPFVKQAFEKYCMTTSRDSEPIFSVLSLDTAKSEESFIEDEDEKKKVESRISVIDRLVRDSVKVKKLKEIYGNSCQICNEQITLIDEISYSEVHHIQPFNKLHQGIDDKSNMIVVCPNHHKLFDMGIIALDPENHQRILHVDSKNPLHQKMLMANKHRLSSTHVRYHYENIFMPLRESLLETRKQGIR